MLNHNETLINEAIDYRLSLDNRTEVERNLIYPIYRRLVLPEIISNFSWKDVNSSKLLKSSEYNFYLKNLKTFLYSNFKLAESYRSILDTKSKQTFNEIHEIKNKYSKLQDLFFGIKKDLAFSGTTTTSKSFFEERGLEEIYDLEDNKDTFDFFKLNLSKSKVNILESAIEEEVQVHPVNAYVFGKSINSSKIEQSDSIDYLWRDNKRFKYIVFKKAPSSDVLVRDDTAELNLIIDFGFIQSLNEMTIDGGSYLPVVLNESKLEYYDQDTAEWKLIQLSIKRNNLNNKILMFNTIKTNKVRLQFQQFKSLDNVAEAFLTRDEAFTVDMLNPGNSIPRDSKLYKVYDLSIDSIKSENFDLMILHGGQPGTDNLKNDPRVSLLLKEMESKNKLIGAICAAPIILEENGILQKRRRTSHPSIKGSLSGDLYLENRVVVDHNIITSRSPGTAMEFSFKLVEILYGKDRVRVVNKGVLAKI